MTALDNAISALIAAGIDAQRAGLPPEERVAGVWVLAWDGYAGELVARAPDHAATGVQITAPNAAILVDRVRAFAGSR